MARRKSGAPFFVVLVLGSPHDALPNFRRCFDWRNNDEISKDDVWAIGRD
jgi:hypothetical protein